MKLETSNLAHRWMAVSTNEKNAKLGQKRSLGDHVAYFSNCGTLYNISCTKAATNFKFGTVMEVSEN